VSDFQIAYTIAMVAITYLAWGKQRYALAVLGLNLIATLAVCLAMDLGYLDRDGATASMMVTDIFAGALLVMRPGLSRIISWGYAVTVPVYAANLTFDVQPPTTYAILNAIAGLQLGVLTIGMGGSFGGGGKRGRSFSDGSVAISEREPAISAVSFLQGRG